jgi:hypothetical protein
MTTYRKHTVAEEPVTSVLPDGDVPYNSTHSLNADDEALAALGYKSEFKREFSLFTTFCVSFAVLGLLPSFASTLYYGMGYAGTAGMVQHPDVRTACETYTNFIHQHLDLGLDRRHDRDPVCGYEYGGTV